MQSDSVIQRYIADPLLIDGFKFDLRIYVMLIGIESGDMHAFIADEGLARFCTVKYEKPTKQNLKKTYMHLTNYSVNKNSKEYNKDPDYQDILEPNDGTKRTLTSVFN